MKKEVVKICDTNNGIMTQQILEETIKFLEIDGEYDRADEGLIKRNLIEYMTGCTYIEKKYLI